MADSNTPTPDENEEVKDLDDVPEVVGKTLKQIAIREVRAITAIPLIGILYLIDVPIANVVMLMILLTTIFVILSHVYRRILFFYLDMGALYTEVVKNKNLAAAIVFASVVIFLLGLIYTGTSVLGFMQKVN
jgi:hypothetical protein